MRFAPHHPSPWTAECMSQDDIREILRAEPADATVWLTADTKPMAGRRTMFKATVSDGDRGSMALAPTPIDAFRAALAEYREAAA